MTPKTGENARGRLSLSGQQAQSGDECSDERCDGPPETEVPLGGL